MNSFTEKEFKAKQQITELEKKIIMRSEEITGEVGDFHFFVKEAIVMKLHAFNSNDYPYRKPTFEEYENIMFNIDLLKDIFESIGEIQYLESELLKKTITLN